MNKKRSKPIRRMLPSELKRRLSALQKYSPKVRNSTARDEEMRAVLHELETSQIELEAQNRELIESRHAITESHERYVNLYDFAPIGYMTTDKAGIVLDINLAASDLLGIERQRLLGKPFGPKIYEQDRKAFRDHLANCREGEKTTSTVLRFRHNDEPRFVELLSVCERDRKSGTLKIKTAINDLTAQRKSEKERQELSRRIKAAHQELFDFFMQAPVPMAIVTGPDHVFTLANSPYIEAAGLEVVGRTAQEVFSHSSQSWFTSSLDRVFRTGRPFVGKEIKLIRKTDGHTSEHFVNVSFTAFRAENGTIKGVLICGQEVTDQVIVRLKLELEAKRELRRQEELKEQKAGAERASQSKSAFLANMSHEIRTPLGAILGFTELIAKSNSATERTELAKVILRNGKVLTRLIDDILDLSKVEAGRLELEKIEFDLRELLDDVIGLFRDCVQKKAVLLKVMVSPKTPKALKSDPTRIRQILVNLIGNAVKFTSAGEIAIKVKPVFTFSLLSSIEFKVQDTGIGMTNDQALKLFEPFSQADNTTTRKFGGSGLGLVLSRRLARALGGDVRIVRCGPGKGCLFAATVEARAVKQMAEAKERCTPATKIPMKRKQEYRVLLVEDSPDNQLLISMLLSNAGITVEVASNGAEGVEMAEHNDYDVVLMDMQMPILDGYEATKQLRHDGYKKPIVALTAHAMVEDRNRILALGCDAYLTKPLDFRLLIDTVNRFGLM